MSNTASSSSSSSYKKKKLLVTAALPYANGALHIGHLAGVYIPADIFVRYNRLNSNDILFVSGSDEHGVPITLRAKKENVTPQKTVDKFHTLIKDTFVQIGITFDNYSRTSSPIHHQMSQSLFTQLFENGVFEEKTTEQFYDEKEKSFLADRYITGICPKCNFQEAYGDQCESCGSTLSPDELLEPKSMISGNSPTKKSTKHWYLPLKKYEAFLSDWILTQHEKDWKPNVYGQCKSWITQGLKSRAMTRDLDWGVAIPHCVESAKGKVMYVWFDAPIGYISSTKEWADKNGKQWEDYWKDSSRKLIHFIGKDNIVFHCITFPTILKALGDFNLPTQVPANEFMNLEKNKVSTSRNHAVWVREFIQENPDKIDVLRYVLAANIPETKDSDFNWDDFKTRNNAELVGILGNFVNRCLVLMQKYYKGVLPPLGKLQNIEKDLIQDLEKTIKRITKAIESYKFREALTEMIEVARIGNKYLAETEPWKIIQSDAKRVETIMHICTQIVAQLSVITKPFIPFSAEKIEKMLNIQPLKWGNLESLHILDENHQINLPSLLFNKIEDDFVTLQRDKLMKNSSEIKSDIQPNKQSDIQPILQSSNQSANMENSIEKKSTISPLKEAMFFDDFLKLDMRIGEILEASNVPKSNKLLKLLVDIGEEKRTILSGIAKYYSPESLIGKKVTVLINLPPRKMMGIASEGMILMAEDGENINLLHPDKKVKNGSVIG